MASSLRRIVPLRGAFPWIAPTWPGTIARPPAPRKLGADYDTRWARTPSARVARAAILDAVIRPGVAVLASPEITGLDRLVGLEPPVIFAANHASHLDTGVLLSCLPARFRYRTVVAAAADYFFDTPAKAAVSALAISAIPIDRTTVSRRSIGLATELIEDGWSLIIFPEGGRTPDGWARPFTGGAAFLARRAGVAVVPVHLEGTRRVLRKGAKWPQSLRRSTVHVTFGTPIRPEGIETRELSSRIERTVAVLADEQATDWWTARRRAAAGTTPSLSGPEAGAWRRAWHLGEGRREATGVRWPD